MFKNYYVKSSCLKLYSIKSLRIHSFKNLHKLKPLLSKIVSRIAGKIVSGKGFASGKILLKGYSFIELSITFIVLGLMMMMFGGLGRALYKQYCVSVTNQRYSMILQAIGRYTKQYGCLPYPSTVSKEETKQSDKIINRDGGNNNSNNAEKDHNIISQYGNSLQYGKISQYGVSQEWPTHDNWNSVKFYGYIPWRTLGLPEETAFDGHGNEIVYVMHPKLGGRKSVVLKDENKDKGTSSRALLLLQTPTLSYGDIYRNAGSNYCYVLAPGEYNNSAIYDVLEMEKEAKDLILSDRNFIALKMGSLKTNNRSNSYRSNIDQGSSNNLIITDSDSYIVRHFFGVSKIKWDTDEEIEKYATDPGYRDRISAFKRHKDRKKWEHLTVSDCIAVVLISDGKKWLKKMNQKNINGALSSQSSSISNGNNNSLNNNSDTNDNNVGTGITGIENTGIEIDINSLRQEGHDIRYVSRFNLSLYGGPTCATTLLNPYQYIVKNTMQYKPIMNPAMRVGDSHARQIRSAAFRNSIIYKINISAVALYYLRQENNQNIDIPLQSYQEE